MQERNWPDSPIIRVDLTAAGGPALDDAAIRESYAWPERPFLRANFVASADGASDIEGTPAPMGGPADLLVLLTLRELADVVILGAGTIRSDDFGALRVGSAASRRRLAAGRSAHPRLVVVSAHGNIDPERTTYTEAPVPPLVYTSPAGAERLRDVSPERIEIVVVGSHESVDLTAMMHDLKQRGYARLLSEGGPGLFGSLVAEGLIDELCLTFDPALVGGGSQRILSRSLPQPVELRLTSLLRSGSVLLTRYAVTRTEPGSTPENHATL